MNKIFFLFVSVFLISDIKLAFAEELNSAVIEQYYDKVKKLYTTDAQQNQAIADFVELTASDKAQYKNRVTANLSEKVIEVTIDKKQMVESLRSSKEDLLNSKAQFTITDISFENDDHSIAKAKYTFLLSGDVKREIKQQEGIVNITFQSLSTCEERFTIEDNMLKTLGSNCTVEIVYGDPVALQ